MPDSGQPGLARLHDELGWPAPENVLAPKGGAGAMYARLAREKIGTTLKQRFGPMLWRSAS
jgi:hypothetical protein